MSSSASKLVQVTRHKQRHIALKLLYFGWDYNGLAEQGNNENTIEFHLINALVKTCLIESRQTCQFNRCGRTDKGVSSYGQVINLNVRSNLIDEQDPQNVGLFSPESYIGPKIDYSADKKERDEIRYVDILNRVLPDHIKVIAWAPVMRDFSSRFSCKGRSYSYIFPRGDLCIEAMSEALKYLIGQHDFRNMCSHDLKNGVVNYVRTILDTSIKPLSPLSSQTTSDCNELDDRYKFYEVVIVGQAFLYHQIRNIMTIIFLVGRRLEQPEVIRDLLDLDKCPSKPKFCRASALPLSLFDCQYNTESLPLGWFYEHQTLFNIYKQLKRLWLDYKTKSMMIERVLLDVESRLARESSISDHDYNLDSWKDFGLEHDNMCESRYIPLLRRPRDEPLDSKIENMTNKKKLKMMDADSVIENKETNYDL